MIQSQSSKVKSKPQRTRWDSGTSNAWQGPNQTLAKPQRWQKLSQKKKKVPRCVPWQPEALSEGPTGRKGILKRQAWHRRALAGRARRVKASGEHSERRSGGHTWGRVLQAQATQAPPQGTVPQGEARPPPCRPGEGPLSPSPGDTVP